MLDIVCVLGILALAAIVALVGRGVEAAIFFNLLAAALAVASLAYLVYALLKPEKF